MAKGSGVTTRVVGRGSDHLPLKMVGGKGFNGRGGEYTQNTPFSAIKTGSGRVRSSIIGSENQKFGLMTPNSTSKIAPL